MRCKIPDQGRLLCSHSITSPSIQHLTNLWQPRRYLDAQLPSPGRPRSLSISYTFKVDLFRLVTFLSWLSEQGWAPLTLTKVKDRPHNLCEPRPVNAVNQNASYVAKIGRLSGRGLFCVWAIQWIMDVTTIWGSEVCHLLLLIVYDFLYPLYFSQHTSDWLCSCFSVSSVVLVVTIGPESSTTFPSSRTTCRFTRVSICLFVVSSTFFFVTHSSAKKNQNQNREIHVPAVSEIHISHALTLD